MQSNPHPAFPPFFNCPSLEWRISESNRLSPVWPGFKSWRRRQMCNELVVGSLPCSEMFFFGLFLFPFPQFDSFDPGCGTKKHVLGVLLINCYIDRFIWVDWTKSSVIFNTDVHQGLILSALYYSIYLSKLTMISPTISQGSCLLYSIITRSFHLNDRIRFNHQSHDFFYRFLLAGNIRFWVVCSFQSACH